MTKAELQSLFKKYYNGTATEQERAQLEAWYLEHNETSDQQLSQQAIDAAKAEIFRRLPGNETQFFKFGVRLTAAAVLIGILIALTMLLLKIKQGDPAIAPNDVPPGGNRAVLTLPSGQLIDLTAANNGQLGNTGSLKVIKTKQGKIILSYTDINSQPEQHTITTPNGGQWQVRLPDNTEVWLNAASSLTFPSTFKKSQNRIVKLTGEGYFEVAKDAEHPFIVLSGDQRVEVLGTHFNISSYDTEPAIKTTLAEGRVKVSQLGTGNNKILIPGTQAILTQAKLSIQPADLQEVLAWKDGYFQFDDEPIGTIMPKLARWYDVQVNYQGNVPTEGLSGKISRNKNISQVLKALEATGTVHFKVEGRRITVMR